MDKAKAKAKQRRNTSGLIPWKPGQSGNPKGRPSNKQRFSTLAAKWLSQYADKDIREKLQRPDMTQLDLLAYVLVQRAIKGDRHAVMELLDRLDPKTKYVNAEIASDFRIEYREDPVPARPVDSTNGNGRT